jgi:asparaginyl-tRNA synthetase
MADEVIAPVQLSTHAYLESLGISFRKMTFPNTTEKGALSVARVLGNVVTPRQVVKSLMFETGSDEIILVLVGGDQNVISGSLKKVVGDRNVRMASRDRIHDVTGYQVGSIPPFSWQPPDFRTIIDTSLLDEPLLAVGSGTWGHEILLTPADLVRASSAKSANLTGIDVPAQVLPAAAAVAHPIPSATNSHEAPSSVEIPSGIEISKLHAHVGAEVCVRGWLSNERSSGGMLFLELRDGSGFLQAAVEKSSVGEECWDNAQRLTRESSCYVRGIVRADKRAPTGIELTVSDLKVIQLAENYPIGRKEYGPEFLFNLRHLHVRSKLPWAILRIRDEVFHRFTEFLRNEGYLRTDTPILQPIHCEDSTQLFETDYFGDPMYLSQSGQLYLEALLHGLGKVYDFGPVFRAEQSKTRKHLCEFWMLDWETPFADQSAAEDLLEGMIKHVLAAVLEHRRQELEILKRDVTALQRARDTRFVRLELRDAITILNEHYGMSFAADDDLSAEAEEKLGDHFGIPVFVKNYPFSKKAFYMKHYGDIDGIERAICADLIAPEGAGEVATCAVRENSYENLVRNLRDRGQSAEEYSWYLDVRRYGGVPHAGGGIGPERMVRWLTGVHHIREAIPFPRTLVRRTP